MTNFEPAEVYIHDTSVAVKFKDCFILFENAIVSTQYTMDIDEEEIKLDMEYQAKKTEFRKKERRRNEQLHKS